MRFSRRQKSLRFHLYLLAAAVLLRSFIAPGFMLSVSSNGSLGLALCDGPVAMYQARQQSDDVHDHHKHHANEDGTTESHVATFCSFWSTSSVLVFNSDIEYRHFVPEHSLFSPQYNSPGYRAYSDPARVIRGPPVFFS